MNNFNLQSIVNTDNFEKRLLKIYLNDEIEYQKERLIRISNQFSELYGKNREVRLFTAPGRTEVGGNHTDHNHGKVLAAAINLDALAVAGKSDNTVVRVKSEGYNMDTVDISDSSIHPNETGHSASLIRGVAVGFINRGYKVGGFDAVTTSDVLSGSGLSSSAAFEVLIGTIFNHLFNDGKISPIEIAQIAQYSENVYFNKPCGLMDQMACSVGGFVKIDFNNPDKPIINRVEFDFESCNHSLCIIDTGANHSDLTDEYAAVRGEMEKAASVFGQKVLRDVSKETVINNISLIRKQVNDRAVLRALHFYGENEKVEVLSKALSMNDFNLFKETVTKSGFSSFMYNQNIFSCKNPSSQAVSVALAICGEILGSKGAYRVHGGGFAGTIQAFVPDELLNDFKNSITTVFGENSCHILKIRNIGGAEI